MEYYNQQVRVFTLSACGQCISQTASNTRPPPAHRRLRNRGAQVVLIINAVVAGLQKNSSRKFSCVWEVPM